MTRYNSTHFRSVVGQYNAFSLHCIHYTVSSKQLILKCFVFSMSGLLVSGLLHICEMLFWKKYVCAVENNTTDDHPCHMSSNEPW